MKTKKRRAGVLLHPTSLYSHSEGIGTIGNCAYQFINFLGEAGLSLWQILPLNPPNYGDSPYSSLSAFAGNPLLIDLLFLQEKGYIRVEDIPSFSRVKSQIDFEYISSLKIPILEKAALQFIDSASEEDRRGYLEFKEKANYWLDDFSLFSVIKKENDKEAIKLGVSSLWVDYWQEEEKFRSDTLINQIKREKREEIEVVKVIQYFFFYQWMNLKNYAKEKGVSIVGDIPIFVALDSSDVWAHPEIFKLDEDLNPYVVAGVPPDYFSEDGQLWGNPLYDWDFLKKSRFEWWIKRFEWLNEMVDCIRIDHFKGFESCWEVPRSESTARQGRWVETKGEDFFDYLFSQKKDINIWVEDLGIITEEVEQLRDKYSFPGLKVLEFAFEGAPSGKWQDNNFLPHNYNSNCIVYTGTHDNDTSRGWFNNTDSLRRERALIYLKTTETAFVWDFIRLAFSSVADFAIIPMQDFLNLDSSSRMNTPSTVGSNWAWQMDEGSLSEELAFSIRELVNLFSR